MDRQISEEDIHGSKGSCEYFEESMNSPVEYSEDSIPLSTSNIARQKWLPSDASKHSLLVNVK